MFSVSVRNQTSSYAVARHFSLILMWLTSIRT